MKRVSAILLSVIFMISALAACDQFKNMGGNKAEEEKKKMEEMASQVAQKLAEDQKKVEEEKAKMNQQIETEVQKRLAEEKAKAAAAQPQTQPTAQQPVPEKIVERIIIKEKATDNTKEKNAERSKEVAEKLSGYLRIYIDKGLRGGSMTIPFGRNISTSNGTGFKDNCSSASYHIPAGWQVSLYAGSGYSEKRLVLSGSGSVNDLGNVNDKCSSFRWEKQGE